MVQKVNRMWDEDKGRAKVEADLSAPLPELTKKQLELFTGPKTAQQKHLKVPAWLNAPAWLVHVILEGRKVENLTDRECDKIQRRLKAIYFKCKRGWPDEPTRSATTVWAQPPQLR